MWGHYGQAIQDVNSTMQGKMLTAQAGVRVRLGVSVCILCPTCLLVCPSRAAADKGASVLQQTCVRSVKWPERKELSEMLCQEDQIRRQRLPKCSSPGIQCF